MYSMMMPPNPEPEPITPDNAAIWVCIDSFVNHELQGFFCCCFQPEPIYFSGSGSLLISLENLCDSLNFPNSFFEKRSFTKKVTKKSEASDVPEGSIPNLHSKFHDVNTIKNYCGKLATFEIKIFFRQHSSWQGSVFWKEGKREIFFRSALELLYLLYSAMEAVSQV